MSDVRELRYDVKLTVNEFKERMSEIGSLTSGLEDKIKRASEAASEIGRRNGFGALNSAAKETGNILEKITKEAEKLNNGVVGTQVNDDFAQLNKGATELSKLLRELKREKEQLMRGGLVGEEIGGEKTLSTVLAQIKAVEDELKRIKALDLNKIIDNKQVAQFKEYTAAIDTQRKALESLDRSMVRHKALAQSTYQKYSVEFNGANKTLAKLGFNTQENPFGDWSQYVQGIAAAKAQVSQFYKHIEENRAAIEARHNAQNGNYNGNNEFSRAWNKVRDDAEKWTVAISRGKQLTDEELRAAQRVTAEYRKQVEVLAGGDRHVMANMPKSPVLDYSNAKDFNAASTAARDASAIARNMGNQTAEVRSYEQEIRRLQSRCEALYATYRKAPTQENLQAFAKNRAALQATSKEYERYQRRVEGASRTESEFMRKAMSHFQWISTGLAMSLAGGTVMGSIGSMKDIDYQMAGIRQVIPSIEANPNLKNSNPAEYALETQKMNTAMTDFIDIAAKYGQSTSEVLESARSIGRMYGQGENGVINTKLFTDQAAKMAVADAFSMEEATKGLEAAMSQWNLQTENTNDLLTRSSEIIDIWTRAAHSGAASGQDISQAIQVAGASAAQAGISFSFFTSLVETGVRTTARSGNEIGQALKSLFVTMGSGKADKALAAWGIKTRELGTDGKEHVRSLEKQILDVSLAVSSTEKDTTKFLSTLAGGKYQYSKISAILKNYKEILRMQGVLNDGHTKGFADEQVQVQLDTIKRKIQQAQAEYMNLIADMGQAGGFDGLKQIVTVLRDVTTGFRKMTEDIKNGNSSLITLAKYLPTVLGGLAALKAAQKVYSYGRTAYETVRNSGDYLRNGTGGSFTLFADTTEQAKAKGMERAAVLGTGHDVLGSKNDDGTKVNSADRLRHAEAVKAETRALQEQTTVVSANTVATAGNTSAETANTGARTGNTTATAGNTVSTTAETGAKARETAAEMANTGATDVNSVAKRANAGASLQEAAGSNAAASAAGRQSVAMRVLASASATAGIAMRGLQVGLAALGGPVGIAVTALSVAVPYLLATAEAEGKEANAVKEATDALEKKIETAQQEYDQTERRETAALQVAEAYNRVRESLATMQEGSEEYKAKQEQLQDMETTLGQILHTNADQFITDNGIKMDSIKDYMGKEKSKHIQEQTDIMNTAKNNADATKTQIQSTKARIESMKEELKQVRANGNGWNWLNRVMNNARYKAALEGKKRANDLLAAANTYKEIGGISGFFNDWTVEANGGVDALVQKASDMWNKFDQQEKEAIDDAKNIGDVETFEAAIGGYEASLGHMEEVLAGHEKVAAAAAQSVADLQRGVNTDTNTATPDNNNYGREPRSRNGRKGRHEKVTIDYAGDELSAAIHEAAQSDIAQQYKFTEPLLRAIAARESGGDTTIRQWDGNGNLLEDYAGSGHFGMFQVTRADAERFGTGDISVPLNNAMTAVKLLAEKFDNTGELWKAVRAYNGGSDSYVAQVRKNFQAQKESFNFGIDDGFGLPGSFNDDVIAGVKEELGQDYGGGSWRDATVKVCTTLIQKALINAGVDEDTVDNLSAWAPNWSKAGSYAFHPYSEIQSGGYIPKTGDIGLVNTQNGENGHAGHVIMIGENGEGYYAASKPGTKSAYYGTNWETAFAHSGIEGVISVNELAGKPYTASVRGGKKKPKSINDFQLDPYQEALYREQLANEDADKMTYRGKSHDFYNGGSLGQDRAALAVAELKLASQQAAKEILEATLDSTQKNIKNALATTHKDIGEVLAKRGTTWQKLVPAERKALADLAGDDSFKKQVESEEKIRQKIVQTTKAIEEQRQARDKAMGYMNVDERNKYMADQVVKDYDMLHPNDVSGSPGRKKVLEIQREYLEDNLRRAKERYANARAKGMEERSDKLADIEAAQAKLKELEDKATAGDTSQGLTQKIADQTAEVARLKDEYQSMAAVGTKAEQDEKKAVDECTEALKNNANAIKKVQQDFAKLVFDGTVSMFTNVLAEGKSFRDSFKELWADIGKFALKQLLMIQLQSVIVKAGWGSAFGFTGGGAIPGKAIGGTIPGYASGGQTAGAIAGAGTGTSDSILAYIGNKDRFVYLSNGEYVMTAEATQRIGKDNLDRMNYGKYATGGAISPTPYVPHIATSVTKKAEVLNRDNPNAKLESLMAQQTDLLRNMGKDGNGGGLVVLNTQASSEQVMKALAENPRALNAILGRNQRMGFR